MRGSESGLLPSRSLLNRTEPPIRDRRPLQPASTLWGNRT